MTIDPEKLEEAIKEFEEVERRWGLNSNQKVLLAAARSHPARLPRYKEVEIAQWVAIDAAGSIVGFFNGEEEAVRHHVLSLGPDSYSAIRLTGTAKVKVTP